MFHDLRRCSLVHSVSGAATEIFATGRLLRPHILSLPSTELLVGHDNLSSFVGEPCSLRPLQRDGQMAARRLLISLHCCLQADGPTRAIIQLICLPCQWCVGHTTTSQPSCLLFACCPVWARKLDNISYPLMRGQQHVLLSWHLNSFLGSA